MATTDLKRKTEFAHTGLALSTMSGLLAALVEGRVESVTSELRRLTDAAGGVHSRAVGLQGPGLASAPSKLCDSCVPRRPDLSFLSVQTLSSVARTQEVNTRQ